MGKNGQPEGNGCVKHRMLAVRLCPLDSFDDIVEKVNNNNQFKTVFFESERLLSLLDEGRTIPQVVPPTSVETMTKNRHLVGVWSSFS